MLSVALPYHLKVRDHFKEQRKTWDFFTAAGAGKEEQASFKTELLKNSYKFQPDTDLYIYDKIALAKEKLGLEGLGVTAYQAQYTDHLNASITYFDQEAQLVFSGDLTQRLNGDELLAVIAHELAHVKLFSLLDGELEVADRIITAIAGNDNSQAAYHETARLFRLYTEIYCDRGALTVLGEPTPVINMLLKIATGLSVVDAESYSKQAEEIFSISPDTQVATPTHPENFIRSRALGLWFEKQAAAEPEIARMIEGLPDLDRLDIFSQKELAALTRDFLSYYLRPKWFQSALVISLAREYFPDHPWEQPVAGGKQRPDRGDVQGRLFGGEGPVGQQPVAAEQS
ncbi:MAG TPA: M48 family metalloprotease, partial [Puia sp.]